MMILLQVLSIVTIIKYYGNKLQLPSSSSIAPAGVVDVIMMESSVDQTKRGKKRKLMNVETKGTPFLCSLPSSQDIPATTDAMESNESPAVLSSVLAQIPWDMWLYEIFVWLGRLSC